VIRAPPYKFADTATTSGCFEPTSRSGALRFKKLTIIYHTAPLRSDFEAYPSLFETAELRSAMGDPLC